MKLPPVLMLSLALCRETTEQFCAHQLLEELFPFQQGPVSPLSLPLPFRYCLSWQELSIMLLTDQWVQRLLLLAMASL